MERKVIILDHHPADSRTDIADDQIAIQTLTSRMGTGGGNVPIILESKKNTDRIAGPLTFDARGNGGGRIVNTITGDHESTISDYTAIVLEPVVLEYHSQALRIKPLKDDISPTIPAGFGEGGANTTTPVLIVEPITYDSQVTNPLHKDNTQGGVCHTLNSDSRNYVVIPLEGNGARPSHHGNGYRNQGTMYTLNTTEVHSIAYAFEPGIAAREGSDNRFVQNKCPTLRADMGDNQPATAYGVARKETGKLKMPDKEETTYIVRRLTPTECARLQGFPDWWCADVPHADSVEYKLWGNGISLPVALYVMEGIAKALKEEEGEQNRIPDNSGNEGGNTA